MSKYIYANINVDNIYVGFKWALNRSLDVEEKGVLVGGKNAQVVMCKDGIVH